MLISRHGFTDKIIAILDYHFPTWGEAILSRSTLLQYLNYKTKAANRGSKSRAGFGNIYAIYVLVEDYVENEFHNRADYKKYEGAQFSKLLKRQRELPFGNKLQNHALNHRLNQEFTKLFPAEDVRPIIRDNLTNRYWINENLLRVYDVDGKTINISRALLDIINAYSQARMESFHSFMQTCEKLSVIREKTTGDATDFIKNLLKPEVDARIFEIVSYAILKQSYADVRIYWGWSPHELNQEFLTLYKTGRTNANDGGIDFIMKPLGRIFQVTESTDVGKYFLDIDKIQRYPITFVVKSVAETETILSNMREQAKKRYVVERIIERYMDCVEEIINIPKLIDNFNSIVANGHLHEVVKEIVRQGRTEFNVNGDEIGLAD